MNCKFKIILFISFFINTINAQKSPSKSKIQKISFIGLEKTKESYLNNILKNKISGNFDKNLIKEDVQLLRNLPSVAKIDFEIDSLESGHLITYIIEERRTALPIINFGGIRNNIWFSVGAIENNFQGRGDLALAYYQNNNGRHSGQVYYKRPRLNNSNWGYSFTLNKWSSLEPVFFENTSVEYFYDNNGLGLSLIRNFGLRYQVEVGGTYFVESYKKNSDDFQINLPGPDEFSIEKALTKLELKQNLLDYDYFYIKGIATTITYQNVINLDQTEFFNSIQLESKLFFRPFQNINLALRFKFGISTNNDSPFAPFVADSHFNIRGIGNRIDRGTAQAILNIESRYTVYHKKHLSSQIVAFADSGTWRNPGGAFRELFDSNQFRQFIGLGFRINYQKVFGATLRVDYGVDIFNKEQKGFVIGLGQYF